MSNLEMTAGLPGKRTQEWSPTRAFLPLILGKETDNLNKKETKQIELFEKGLERNLSKDDTIESAVSKIVKVALAAEYGPSLVADRSSEPMVRTIAQAILNNSQLRKQALMLIDRFADHV
ncbi:hypothetical protein A3K48_06615 [candidate division WOR-1 bacterium RIFOXYA12_FULL_52_29]|uniref:Uncharacterized protein n=1 Tax=candidate division WOR-1 bacterium RIFOXYC12_FULL_54_18 TaxID=1802584 RepID=A0A1F4T753_UNCSA|nr:MAG: hypothetical protein A3K44_06615 [candidate division WOR-1 bacterium RIFOXYA2_FULL_51_19]OGC18194.1 MAG: hypothetical protein A3K48_06615 [candidate division WOR-1 bacterium RIFOXYA12_FULL_52_29]OGC27049.1 MAG: hypothetical protein A3K32_06610 [candidate division WOR-1 bacterium RIFOXYB2_FULL_45_9]OGC28611.1 MAG: hypothetical protein A3K49_06615 [candidate division WOR-1 bacterium RIFOXYC12_FULL_54_18]OGC30934.1 MAG: hypothetical protein A2346_06005 [candidate division WOR-1 bacterium R